MKFNNHVEHFQNPNPFLPILSRKSPIPTIVIIFNNFEKKCHKQVITRKLVWYPTTISLHKNKKLKNNPTKIVPIPIHFTNLSLSSLNNNKKNCSQDLRTLFFFLFQQNFKVPTFIVYTLYPEAQRAKNSPHRS